MQKELMLEQVRRQSYPAAVSRLHGIYLWEDEQSAKRGERWRDAEGNQFHPDYLVEVSFTYRRLSRVDTNWIDKYLLPDSMPLTGMLIGCTSTGLVKHAQAMSPCGSALLKEEV
jgi:hypothetical protein